MYNTAVKNVEDYEPSPRSDPRSYPGKRPSSSFIFSNKLIFQIEIKKKYKVRRICHSKI